MSAEEIKRRAKERDLQIEATVNEIRRFFEKSLHKLLSKTGEATADEMIYAMGRLYEDLQEAGLNERLEALSEVYADELASVQKVLKSIDRKLILTDSDADIAATLIDYDYSAIETKMRSSVITLRSITVQGIIGQSPVDFDAVIDKFGARIASELATEMRTNLSGFNQAVIHRKAERVGFDTFEYLGPDDGVTRPFCKDLIERGRIFTKEEIANMDNLQGLDPFIYGGGYNCRHQWRPVDTDK
jgi:hypothetical protein